MTARLKGKVAIVTGAGSVGPGWGNGRATAVLFAREGASVLIADQNIEAAEATAEIIRKEGGQCHVAQVNVMDEKSVAAMTDSCVRKFKTVDILHNNVGASMTGGPMELSLEDFQQQLQLNLTSVFLTCRSILPLMVKQKSGSIINVGSIGGMRHLGHHHVGYSAAKAGLVQFSRQIAVQHGPDGVRCNTIIPGLIDAPLLEHRVSQQQGRADLQRLRTEAKIRVPLGKRGDAWDTAYAALYLASDEAKYISGTEILVDGGLLARSA